ncbi:MAG: hypothetical protein E3J37_01115 [Anaerolineales bacterium]|nr:MAG: hypothetical protein E3J37_01115 [Anaerolineales bacterium]
MGKFMADVTLDPKIASAFQCAGKRQLLAGGEGHSLRVGQCVFKPIENVERYSWSCDLLLKLSRRGFRISEPRRAIDGSFVYHGWAASNFEPGEHVTGRWHEKLNITRMFHSELNDIAFSPMPPSNDVWSLAHEITWQLTPLPPALHLKMTTMIEEIFTHYQPLSRYPGIIHSDICGNVLFHEELDPCVIDFSPAFGSVEYAEAILVADAIAWQNAPLDIVNLLPFNEHYRQYLLRAINFRIIVAALYKPKNIEWFLREYAGFQPVISIVS